MNNPFPHKPFYFLRHGESLWNIEHKFAGARADAPLTDKGIEQAQTAALLLPYIRPAPSICVHSTLQRAAHTALIVNQNSLLPMEERFHLREIDAGVWTGRHNQDAIADWAAGRKPDNGESLAEFSDRIVDVYTDILTTHDLPLIVAHGRILNAIDEACGISPRSLQATNCSMLYFKPKIIRGASYPWDVTALTLKNGQIHEELAVWSQI